MLYIKVEGHIEPLAGMMAKQMPFAMALSLTSVAKDAQAQVLRELPQRFDLKNGWTARNIRIKPARKNDLIAQVTAPDYMAKQETGGTRTPQSGTHLAAPGETLRGRIIPRSMRPGAAFGKPRTFKIYRAGGGEAIAQRLSRRTREFKILYWLTATQDYTKRFEFGQTVAEVVQRKFPSRLAEAMQKAMDTAR